MDARVTRTEDDVRRMAEASAWRVRLAEADADSSEAFEAWLALDARHDAAWNQVQAPWSQIGAQATAPELMALRRAALNRAPRPGRTRWPRGATFGAAAASLATLAVTVALLSAIGWLQQRSEVFQTAQGERRTVTLADGSRLALDSSTELQVRYSKDARKLELVRGQARFDVAHDVQRPFSVHARDQTIVATGTAFNVDVLGPKVLVTLIEGHVVVLRDHPARPRNGAPAAKPAAIELRAGEQLAASTVSPAQVTSVSIEKATAWESGQLVFDDEPLSAVAERISRYSTRPIVVKDERAAALRLSGVFITGDVTTFVDTITRYLPVQASSTPNGEIELRSRR